MLPYKNNMNILELLDGKKTYIVATIAGVVFVLNLLGYITPEVANQLYVILGIGGTVALRDAISKLEK